MNLTLKHWPDPILRRVCEQTAVEAGTEEQMIALMLKHNGVGLSAPQVGLTSRVFVMRDPNTPGKGLAFVNPWILDHSTDTDTAPEGCLSIPGQRVSIARWTSIELTFDGSEGKTVTRKFEGLYARCVQHELDHLDGTMVFDHIPSKLGKKLFLDKYFKNRKNL